MKLSEILAIFFLILAISGGVAILYCILSTIIFGPFEANIPSFLFEFGVISFPISYVILNLLLCDFE